jgi:hypothetical protein
VGTATTHFVGIDVSKDTLNACRLAPDGQAQNHAFTNDPAGHAALLAGADRHAPTADALFGMEATGRYEDALATLRGLPIPYLWGGFVKLDVGDSARPWVRSFANPGLGLPDLATHLPSHDATSRAFGWFAGMLGYALQLQVTFQPGDGVDLGDLKLRLREPTEAEWFLESRGTMLVIEPE